MTKIKYNFKFDAEGYPKVWPHFEEKHIHQGSAHDCCGGTGSSCALGWIWRLTNNSPSKTVQATITRQLEKLIRARDRSALNIPDWNDGRATRQEIADVLNELGEVLGYTEDV